MGVLRLEKFARKVSANYRKPAHALQCDIQKFFYNVDHKILFGLIEKTINDPHALWLIIEVIKSFKSGLGKGLPLGNVTSQLFANIYLNELDQFIKHKLKERYYIRYCDDFVIISEDRARLINRAVAIQKFLGAQLNLSLHPNKVIIQKVSYGVDFLGYVALPHFIVLRTTTRRRMFRELKLKKHEHELGEITDERFLQSISSYLGILKHCKGYALKQKLIKEVGFSLE